MNAHTRTAHALKNLFDFNDWTMTFRFNGEREKWYDRFVVVVIVVGVVVIWSVWSMVVVLFVTSIEFLN